MAKDLGIDLVGMGEGAARALIESTMELPNGTTQAQSKLRETLEAQGLSEKQVETAVQQVRKMGTSASTNYKELSESDRERLGKGLLTDLNPSTQGDLIRNMQSGLILDRIRELSNPEAAQAYAGQADEVAAGVKRGSDLLIQTLGTKYFAKQGATFESGFADTGPTSLRDMYSFDSSTNEFVLNNPTSTVARGNEVIRGINTTIRNTLKAYDNLGRDDMKQQMIAEMQQLFGETDASQGSDQSNSQ